ncbi:GNAT family N-acetyltransferase [Aurantiacibacter poecillastricola]|uniref:GNAT family N-acetyltransferase n=1 Tax=Aurantiacibacter poecillastricola TaxID=3064385 RepID=UPI00273F4CD4|nr:GNAT family N-acetyltransferase [Aurantiacibacter sp. 219JJ12-13]MDP5261494.1 GNAT family N-acetyltransferase [Aurantiacibacter sp. 219JJ12-13]
MFMRTERLFLRPVFPEDWQAIYEGIADFGVVSMLARAPWPYRVADAQSYCRKPAPAGSMKFSIIAPEMDGAPLVGQIGIEPMADSPHELGYWIAPGWQRRGFASEAVGGVLDMARAIGVPRVDAGHYLENVASGKVLKANGFIETGELRPTTCAARGGAVVLARRYSCDLRAGVEAPDAEAA